MFNAYIQRPVYDQDFALISTQAVQCAKDFASKEMAESWVKRALKEMKAGEGREYSCYIIENAPTKVEYTLKPYTSMRGTDEKVTIELSRMPDALIYSEDRYYPKLELFDEHRIEEVGAWIASRHSAQTANIFVFRGYTLKNVWCRNHLNYGPLWFEYFVVYGKSDYADLLRDDYYAKDSVHLS